jgi:hypothetical protein
VSLTPCLHLRIKKYDTFKEIPRAVSCEVLAASSSIGTGVLGQNRANLNKMLNNKLN